MGSTANPRSRRIAPASIRLHNKISIGLMTEKIAASRFGRRALVFNQLPLSSLARVQIKSQLPDEDRDLLQLRVQSINRECKGARRFPSCLQRRAQRKQEQECQPKNPW